MYEMYMYEISSLMYFQKNMHHGITNCVHNNFLLLQGVLLHPDGEVREAGAQRGRQERRGAPRQPRVRALPRP